MSLPGGLVLRVVADLVGAAALVRWGRPANVAAVLLFLANTALGVRAARAGSVATRADPPRTDAPGAVRV